MHYRKVPEDVLLLSAFQPKESVLLSPADNMEKGQHPENCFSPSSLELTLEIF
jgi:hypothetical protein